VLDADTIPARLQGAIRVPDRKVTVYEKRSWPARFETWGEFQNLHGSGDVRIPRVPASEPLQVEVQAFVDAIRTGVVSVASGEEGLAVVEVLNALQRSMDEGGVPITLDALPAGRTG